MKKITLFILVIILMLSAILRFYKIDKIPPSLNWDEAAVGYNAWTILNWGKDEWGKKFPAVFESFGEYKNPVHIYLTVPFVAIFGLNEFGVRASSALFGVMNIGLIFFLARKIFKNDNVAILSSLVLAISPYNIHFSRFDHELNFALFFFMLGLLLFYKGLEKSKYIPFSFFCFCLTIISYNAAKIFVPPTFIFLILINIKKLLSLKKEFFAGMAIIILFSTLLIFDKNISGFERFRQTAFSEKDIQNTQLFKKYNNYSLGFIEIVGKQYILHFQQKFLFTSGSTNPRLSSQGTGEFYKYDIPFLIIGLITTLWICITQKSRLAFLLLFWAFLAPLPSAVVNEAPHAARAMFINGSWHMILALGIYTTIVLFKQKYWRILISIILAVVSTIFLLKYLDNYYNYYPIKYAIEWQYGMKQIVDYIKVHPEFDEVYMTAERQQPYIFFLFYLKTPLPLFLKSVEYNQTPSRSANLVTNYSKFHFGSWNPIESEPIPHILYVVTSSEYDGLRYKSSFNTIYIVKYPDGSDAFYLVSVND